MNKLSHSNLPFLSFDKQIGYDTYNKKMLLRVAEALWNVVGQKEPLFYHPNLRQNTRYIPKWKHVVTEMFLMEGRIPTQFNLNGYYSSIKRILKDIKVIRYTASGELVPGSNWDRFFDDSQSWDWFTARTDSGGIGKIIYITHI